MASTLSATSPGRLLASMVADPDGSRRLQYAARLLGLNGSPESAEFVASLVHLGTEHAAACHVPDLAEGRPGTRIGDQT